jgi:hypothetical protein
MDPLILPLFIDKKIRSYLQKTYVFMVSGYPAEQGVYDKYHIKEMFRDIYNKLIKHHEFRYIKINDITYFQNWEKIPNDDILQRLNGNSLYIIPSM